MPISEEIQMRFLVMTDIEGVTGVTTFPQAEKSEFGKRMLMHDLLSVLDGIKEEGAEAVIYDMHTDGRNTHLSRLLPQKLLSACFLRSAYVLSSINFERS